MIRKGKATGISRRGLRFFPIRDRSFCAKREPPNSNCLKVWRSFNVYLFLKERETECEWGEEQREREKETESEAGSRL